MVFIFAIFALALLSTLVEQRKWAIGFVFAGIFLFLLLFWHHVTDTLQINL